MDDRHAHLRPVPSGGGEALAEALDKPAASGTPGLTPAQGRGTSAMFLTDVVVELGYATRTRVDEVIEEARVAGRSADELLIEKRLIDSDQLSRAIAERYGLDHLDVNGYHVDMGAANLLSVASARRYQAVPVGYVDKSTLLVAVADPSNVVAIDDIQMITGLKCRLAVAAADDIDALIKRLNSLESAVTQAVDENEEAELTEVAELHESADDAPVIKLVYSILGQAATEGASDIHFEPGEDEMRVRFRVDGVLYEAARVPKRMVSGVISRVKIMSELDIAEKRIPQDGRVSVNVDGRKVDLRITTLPTSRGEGATIRILDKEQALRSLDDLGMVGTGRERFEAAVRRSHGAVLVTGPTGSGKSTSLYAALAELNAVERNIITIEDPVEYRLDGVNQINVNRKAGLTFAAGLRSVLRADPDIIMVGEIRDAETARIAIESALTGHMVLTTLHTNNAPATISRLAKMGIESFLTASALECVVAQRLARKLCTHCKRRALISQTALIEAGFRAGTDLEAYEPVGCPRCNHTGYKGRIGVFSVMEMTERLKDMTVAGASEAELTDVAREEGMLTLREDGLTKVRGGVTSIAELARVSS
ncbi:MAG: type pilus assembly protein PilB [Solirubrobacterales bacterium]|nr:type pilus assembly protein PilB [Solirubrobacterales bacterium]